MRTSALSRLSLLAILLQPALLLATPMRLTVVSARLDAAQLKKGAALRSTTPLSDLACLSLPGLRDIAGTCGGADAQKIADRPQVDPLVRIEIGERVIRTYPIPGTLTPRWEYSVVLDSSQLRGQTAHVLLYDYIGPGDERPLGDGKLRPQDLLKPGERKLKLGLAEVVYRIEQLEAGAAPRSYQFHVPGDAQMADLARRAKLKSDGYLLIPISEGELVEVTATGRVRPNARKYPGRAAGPSGVPTITEKIQYNQPGFRGCPGCNHAALIAQLGTTGLVLGEKRQLVAESAGYLLLGVNDVKVSDNDGGFDVAVKVSLPKETQPGLSRGDHRDTPPSAMDPRVVQQTVDSHGAEIDECCAKEPDPYGEVVLSFSISADGSLLGVIVERASPNLKRASDCMRQKALRWRFPPPRGVVTARYPISFSPG